jgi:hypothetical protein
VGTPTSGTFVITQVALALTLMVVSGLLMNMLGGLRNADLGFSPDHILATEVNLSPGRYEGRDVIADFYRPLMDKIRAIPGVQAVGMINILPIQSWGSIGKGFTSLELQVRREVQIRRQSSALSHSNSMRFLRIS